MYPSEKPRMLDERSHLVSAPPPFSIYAGLPPEAPGFFRPGPASRHLEKSALKKQHPKACKIAKVEAFPLYTFRHTCLTRWAGHMDPYTLAYLAGHSDFSTTKRYVHPQTQRTGWAQNWAHSRNWRSTPSCVIGCTVLKTGRINGRGERIRTSGLLDPNQAL